MKPDLPRLLAIVLLTFAGSTWAADAGRVLLAAGDTVAVRDKQIIKLVFGSTVQDKDLLRTGPASNLQVRFVDESILSMRESSEIRIDEFRFTGKEDGSERAFFSLLKGGLRKITGIIGRTNRKNYQMGSVVATIGIRGTDYAATLCQRDCRNPDGALAKDGLYGRVIGASSGTNRNSITNKTGEHLFGIGQNYHVLDAGTAPQLLLEPPGFVSVAVKSKSTKPPAGTGNEQAAAGGAQQDPRGATPPPSPPEFLQFVATENRGAGGTPVVISAGPTIAGVGALMETNSFFNEPNDGGGFFTPANLTTDPPGAASSLATPQKLTGFTLPPGFGAEPGGGSGPGPATGSTVSGSVIDQTVPNSLNAHWGRWTSGTFTNESGMTTTFSSNNQFHYLYGPLTPPDVVAAKSGSFPMSLVQGTTPTNQLGQLATGFSASATVNFTARTVAFGPTSFTFPSDSWSFSGGTTPIQFAAGKGAFIDQVVSGSCFGSTCSTFTPAVLGKTGIFMGPVGDHLGVAFAARTTSGPAASAQTAKIFTCAGSC